jgi:hypothetical protein
MERYALRQEDNMSKIGRRKREAKPEPPKYHADGYKLKPDLFTIEYVVRGTTDRRDEMYRAISPMFHLPCGEEMFHDGMVFVSAFYHGLDNLMVVRVSNVKRERLGDIIWTMERINSRSPLLYYVDANVVEVG